ncbi:MAG: aldehyde ferredoxin oxidoreductase N-terminal domain-containing protein, partial [Candidatus Hodarchaeales archaeon]
MSVIPDSVLEIDLTEGTSKVIKRQNLFKKWIGGVGVGINLLKEYVPVTANPLNSENVMIFSIGTLTTFYPIVSKTVALFRSPYTGDLGESYAGG